MATTPYLATPKPKKEYHYGDIEISLENCILPEELTSETPSMKDGLDKEIEIDLRILGCEYIQTAGILLKLPQVAMATGQVLLQRFYYSKSLVKHDIEICAMASIFLAAKIEESPRRIRDVINVFHHIKQKRCHRTPTSMDYFSELYFKLKNSAIKAERRILKELGFCVHVKHPHKIVITYLQILDCEKNKALAQKAWNYMNDSLRTDVFVRFTPEKIACACIFLAARMLKVILPTNPPWWELFDAELNEVEEIALTLVRLYSRPKKSQSELESAVNKIKEIAEEKKEVNADGSIAGSFTPAHSSPSGGLAPTPVDKKVSPAPSTVSPLKNNNKNNKKEESKETNGKANGSSSANHSPIDESDKSHSKRKQRSPVSEKRRSRSVSESESDSHTSDSEGSSNEEKRSRKSRKQAVKHRKHSSSLSESESDDGDINERIPRQYKYDNRDVMSSKSQSRYRETYQNGHYTKRDYKNRSRSPRRRERSNSRSRSRDRKHRKRDYPIEQSRKANKHRYDNDNDSRSHSSYKTYSRKGRR